MRCNVIAKCYVEDYYLDPDLTPQADYNGPLHLMSKALEPVDPGDRALVAEARRRHAEGLEPLEAHEARAVADLQAEKREADINRRAEEKAAAIVAQTQADALQELSALKARIAELEAADAKGKK